MRLVLLCLAVAACSKSSPTSSAGSAAPASALDAATATTALDAATTALDAAATATFDFDELTNEEQIAFMRNKVMPVMKPAFKTYAPSDFGKFSCKTCHGQGATTKKYKMPNPDLPALDFAALKAGKHAKMAVFMRDSVTPKMAELLNQPVHSPTTPDGFGCLECHLEKP